MLIVSGLRVADIYQAKNMIESKADDNKLNVTLQKMWWNDIKIQFHMIQTVVTWLWYFCKAVYIQFMQIAKIFIFNVQLYVKRQYKLFNGRNAKCGAWLQKRTTRTQIKCICIWLMNKGKYPLYQNACTSISEGHVFF